MRGVLLGILALVLLVPTRGSSQYLFGQNKVVYAGKDWKVIETPRVDLYYYVGEQELAEYIANFTEEVAVEYETTFDHKFEQKIPFILYSSHHDFKQTNIISFMISDYVGGFTELLRGRVALPHTGAWTQLREVTRHELVHAFMNDKLAAIMAEKRRYSFAPMPLWFSEGLAEYIAMPEPGTEARMFMRDFIVNDNLVDIQNLWRIRGTFLMYKEGESLVRYIAVRFGPDALMQIIENWWMSDRFDVVLHKTLGISIEELNRDWKRSLKRRYYPAVMASEWPDVHGRALTRARALNSRPAVIPNSLNEEGDYDFVYLSSSSGNVDIVRARALGDDRFSHERIVKGGRGDNVESIPAFSSGMQVHGSRLAFTAKSGDRDALYLYDLDSRRQTHKIKFPSLITLSSPSWSPDGKSMVISGLDHSGWSDLYRIELATQQLTRLTFDAAHDRDPEWSRDGTRIAWSSDRDAPGRNGIYHICVMNVETGRVTRITSGDHDDAAPSWGPGDRTLLLSSDLDGANNIYLFDFGTSTLTQVTSTLGGLFTPRWTPDGRRFVASSFNNLSFNVYEFDVERFRNTPQRPTPLPQVASVATQLPVSSTRVQSAWVRNSKGKQYPKKEYDTKFGLDFVQGGVAFDPDFFSTTGAQVGFTDLLGNHRIGVLLANVGDNFGQFFKYLNAGASYTNLSKRLNYTVGAFHLTQSYDPVRDVFRFERRIGASFSVSYPISRFRRLESSLVARTSQLELNDALALGVGSSAFMVSNFTSFVHDNTMWSFSGPIDGTRYNLTFGHTYDPTGSNRGGTSAHVDFRRYFRFPSRTVFAWRGIARGYWGDDAQFYWLGGPFDLRGYRSRSLFGQRILLINNELRFPLVDRLLVGLPINAIDLGGFRGSLFSDIARIESPFPAEWIGNYGFGVEMGIGMGFILRWNFGRTHDFNQITDSFQRFFLGWNY